MPDVHAARRLIDQDELWAVLQALTKPDLWLAMLNRNTRPAGYEVFVAFLWQSVFFFLISGCAGVALFSSVSL